MWVAGVSGHVAAQDSPFPPPSALAGKKAGDFALKSGMYSRYPAEWGLILVPENRSREQSRLIRLPFVRIRAQERVQSEPLFLLNGGPGDSSLPRVTRYQLDMATLGDDSLGRLGAALRTHGLESLVNVRNPLDLTPMADDSAYETCTRVFLESDAVDAVVVACVPMTPRLKTAPNEIGDADSLAVRLPRLFGETRKPLIAVIDSGPPFEELVRALRSGGVPVFRTADQAVRSLGRYLCHRASAVCRGRDEKDAGPEQTACQTRVPDTRVETNTFLITG